MIGYWTKQLAGVSPLELPTDRPRPAVRAARGANRVFAISPDLTARLEALGRREGATTFMVLLAAFQTLLHRYSGQDDFAVGTPIANRNRAEIEGLIGYFVNMLALRADLSGDPSFRELLGRVRQVALEAYEHQDLSLDKLIEVLQPPPRPEPNPVVPGHVRAPEHAPMPDIARGDLTLEPLFVGAGERDGQVRPHAGPGRERARAGRRRRVQHRALRRGDDRADARPLPDLAGRDRHRPRATAFPPADSHRARTRSTCSARRAEPPSSGDRPRRPPASTSCSRRRPTHAPEAVALVSGDAQLSYGELERRANQLARHLRALGVEPERPVAIAVADPFEKVVSLLGVLKAGGAYLPLDPTLPKPRLASILDDARVRILLTDATLRANLPVVRRPRSSTSTPIRIGSPASPTIGCRRPRSPANLAYVISTSGSLGQPKGVAVSHASLTSAFHSWKDAYGLDEPGTRHLQMANFAFDVFTGDWVRALGSGGTLVFCPRETLLDPPALHELMVRERVTCAEFVPTVIENLLPYLEESGKSLDFLQLLVVGSDLWHAGEYERLRRLAGPATRVVNSYGLTEATIDSTFFEGSLADRPANRPVPIGRPLSNSRDCTFSTATCSRFPSVSRVSCTSGAWDLREAITAARP